MSHVQYTTRVARRQTNEAQPGRYAPPIMIEEGIKYSKLILAFCFFFNTYQPQTELRTSSFFGGGYNNVVMMMVKLISSVQES